MVIDKGSPLFEAMGGMHNVYINSTGEAALKKGEQYPDKTVLLIDLHEFTISDGSYLEGPRKATAIMLKNKKKYASTGGWGFQAWAGGDPTKPFVTDPTKQCFECHQPKKDQDYVYSTYIPDPDGIRQHGAGGAPPCRRRHLRVLFSPHMSSYRSTEITHGTHRDV